MDEQGYQEVYFYNYCKNCKFRDRKINEEPCDECLSEPINLYSHRPVKYEEDKK